MARTQDIWLISDDGQYIYLGNKGGFDILINGENHYVNFGALHGTVGYGIRDNNGTMEYKNSGGVWTAIGSGGGGTPGGSNGGIQYNNNGAFGGVVISGLVKGNGAGAPSAATAGVDYLTPGTDLDPIAYADLMAVGNVTKSGEQTIDGVLTSASRVLLTQQTAGAENGLWLTGAGAWTRITPYNTDAGLRQVIFLVTKGTANAGVTMQNTNTSAITVDATALTFQAVDAFPVTAPSLTSGATVNLASVSSNFVTITSSFSISSFGINNGGIYYVKFTGIPTLTYNSTSLILPGGADMKAEVGDIWIFKGEGSSNWRCIGILPAVNASHLTQSFSNLLQGKPVNADASACANILNFRGSLILATTATAGATTTLTVFSSRNQAFTGTSAQTIVLPVESTLTVGHKFIIENRSTKPLTVQSSGANEIVVIPGTSIGSNNLEVTCINTGLTTAAAWTYNLDNNNITTSVWSLVPGIPTRASNTTFTITGDLTATFKKKIALKWTESATVRNAMVSIPSTYSNPNTTVTIVGDTMASIDAGSLMYTIQPIVVEEKFAIAGSIGVTGTDVANALYASEPMRIIGADMQAGTAGTTNSTTVNLVNGTGTVTLTSPTLASTVAVTAVPAVPAASALSLALNDRVQLNVTAVQTTAAIDLYVRLYLIPTRYNFL